MTARRTFVLCLSAAIAASACSSDPSAPDERPGSPSAITQSCTFDTAAISSLIVQVFNDAPDENAGTGKWNNIQHQINDLNDQATAQQKAIDFIDFILTKKAQGKVTTDDAVLLDLMTQLSCFVGMAAPTDADNVWVVKVADPTKTFVTANKQSGIQFPGNAVTANTLVFANEIAEGDIDAAFDTELDKYPFGFDWTLVPAQTLTPGTVATIGICPNPAAFGDVTDQSELDDLVNRLVLGHQKTDGPFEVLARVPIPVEMQLECGDITLASSGSAVSRLLARIGNWVLPSPAMAAARAAGGGVGGNTSEFSPFAPVDATLKTGGVGGNTSEFSRADATAVALSSTSPWAGTVGTRRTSGALPYVTVETRRGTPIVGTSVAFATSAPANWTPAGDATLCGNDTETSSTGTAAVTCLDFGTTVGNPVSYTQLKATFTPPARLGMTNGNGAYIVTFDPAIRTWLVESHGATTLAITSPPAGRTVANSNPYTADETIPVTVEVRSSLGEVVPLATPTVAIALNKNAMGAGTVTSKAAVAGVASFTTTVPTAATGYNFIAGASLAGSSVSLPGNTFDVVAGAATYITATTPTSYGSLPASTSPVSPSPTVRVTDAWMNNKAGATVFWTPGGATGSAVASPTTTTAANGTTSNSWTLGVGDNELVAALNAANGTPQVLFSATSVAPTLQVINACAPGGAKDPISDFYFTLPGDRNGTIKSVGLYLSLSGAVGQTDPLAGVPVTIRATRVVGTTTETFTSSATALLRGDNGAANPENKLVTFGFNIPPAAVNGTQPRLTFTFVSAAVPSGRKMNFNVGPCSPGTKCSVPTTCDALEYRNGTTAIYRKSVAVVVRSLR